MSGIERGPGCVSGLENSDRGARGQWRTRPGSRRGVSGAPLRLMAAVLAVLLLAAAVGAQTPTGSGGVNHPRWSEAPYVVLVSFDGLRHDYPDRGLTPNLLRLAERGVRADGLIPMFPSKTFANHYSIATGLAPGRHGIVGNDFYDPGFDATYRLRDRMAVEDGRWYGGEPIWVTAETQGMVTAAMFFVGTEAPVRGVQPTWWHKFDESVTEETRIRRVLDWLALPAERRPHLITLYFERLDSHGHRFGPESAELNASLAVADSLLGRLLEGIAALPHGDRVHVLVVTDHGMSPYVREPVILEDWADLAGVRVIAAGPIAHLYTQGDTARARALRAALAAAPGISAYLPEETPPEWQTARNPRFGDVLVVAEEGVQIRQRHQMGERSPASHGWPATRSMHGAFVAAGPRLRSGLRIPAFENVHIYPLLAEILGLEPARAVDGRLDVLRPILKEAAAPAPR